MNDVLDVALRLIIVFGVFMVVPLVVGQTEHKVMAHMQGRLGPMYAGGFHGWAQLVADGVKFAQKEDIVPADADRRIFQLAPAVALLPYLLVLVAIPIGPSEGAVGQVVDAGIFFVLAVMGVGVLGSLMAGWASANKFSLLGGLRTAAQLLAYELPMLLAAASVAMAAGTVSLPGIVNAFEWWWLPWQIVGALVFFVAGLAELQRPPFDMPVADSEIIFGAYTEYTGLRFALFLLAEYAGIVVLCGLTTVLFLGGWHGPLGADGLGWVWTLLKTARPRLRRHLAARQLPPPARGPAAEARLDHTHPARPRADRAHRHREGGDQLMPPIPGSGLAKGLAVTLRTMTKKTVTAQYPDVQPELPPRSRGVIGAVRGELHGLHAVRPRVPGLVHLHRLPQGDGARRRPGRPRAQPQRPRPLRHRLLPLHVLRYLHRGLSLRRAVLVAGVRVRGDGHPRTHP